MVNPWKDRKSSSLTIQLALKLVDLARGPLTVLGVDVKRMRTILALRLALDLDPRWSVSSGETSLGLILTSCLAWLAGLAPGVLAVGTHDPALWLAGGQSMTLLLLLMFLFTAYGSMIVDTADIRVIASLPVGDRTVFAARCAHVLFYVSLLCACSAFFPTLLGALAFPPWWALTIYPLATFLSGFCAIALVGCAYALVLRIAGPSRFQRFAMWVQILGVSIVIFAMQVGPRLVIDQFRSASLEQLAWLRWVLPPMHQLGLYELVAVGPTPQRIALAALALLAPLIGLAMALALVSRHFVAALSTRETFARRRGDPWHRGWVSRLGRRIAPERDERAGYDFALALSRRERAFLRAVVPQTVLFAAMGFSSLRAGSHVGVAVQRFFACVPIAFSALFGPLAVVSTMSENHDARWILRASPVADWRKFGAAAVRALFGGMVLPSMLALVAFVALASKAEAVGSLIVAFELALSVSLAAVARMHPPFPFCTPPRIEGGSMRDIPVLVGAVLTSLPVAALAAATSWHWAIEWGAAVALAPLCVRGWRRLLRVQFLSLPS